MSYLLNASFNSIAIVAIEFGFDENDLDNYGLKPYLISFTNKIINDDKKDEEKKELIENDDVKINNQKDDENAIKINVDNKNNGNQKNISEKKITKIFESNYDFFESLFLYIGPIQCLIKGKEVSLKIFELFEKFKNRKEKDWNSFKVENIELKKGLKG